MSEQEYWESVDTWILAEEIAKKYLQSRWRPEREICWWEVEPIVIRRNFDVRQFDQLLELLKNMISQEMSGIRYEKKRYDAAIVLDGGNHILIVLETDAKHLKAVIL